jgi:cytoskeletal protein CcmA (bactofilin family)
MREERGQLGGDMLVNEVFTLWGSIGGDVTVVEGGKFYVRGSIYGNVFVAKGGRAHILGQIQGNLVIHRRAKVILSGVVGGDITNLGGRLFINSTSKVLGKWKIDQGETEFEPGATRPN